MIKINKMQENKRKGQSKGQKLPKGQNSEGTAKKREKKKIARQHKLNREKREKFFDNLRELLVPNVQQGILYIVKISLLSV